MQLLCRLHPAGQRDEYRRQNECLNVEEARYAVGIDVKQGDISATHLALASVRVMGPAMCIGEAAGKAAAIAARDGIELRDVDIRTLQDALRQEGVYFRD